MRIGVCIGYEVHDALWMGHGVSEHWDRIGAADPFSNPKTFQI